MKEIVIVGAGYGGVRVAQRLESALRGRSDIRITLINPTPYHTLRTRLHEAAGARVPADVVCMPLEDLFEEKQVRLVKDTVLSVDFENQTAFGAADVRYPYDYLVLATGTVPAFFGIPGAEAFSFPLSTYYDALRLRGHIIRMVKRAKTEPNPTVRKEMLSFCITGAGFTGVEFTGELAEWLPVLCRENGVDIRETRVMIVSMDSRLVPALPAGPAARCKRRLEKMGVEVRLGTAATAVTEYGVTLKQGDAETVYPTRTVVWTTGVSGAPLMEAVSGTLPMKGRLRIETDPYLRAKGAAHVYVVGDNLFWLDGQRPVPQIAENAEESGDLAAANILAEIGGKGEEALKSYHMVSHGTVVCIGKKFCVGRMHFGGITLRLPVPLAIMGKHFIHANYERTVWCGKSVPAYVKSQLSSRKNMSDSIGRPIHSIGG